MRPRMHDWSCPARLQPVCRGRFARSSAGSAVIRSGTTRFGVTRPPWRGTKCVILPKARQKAGGGGGGSGDGNVTLSSGDRHTGLLRV